MQTQALQWVFGYGSLIWNPGFDHVVAQQGLLHGAHRRLCIYSHYHRGTEAQPGLVYGLVPGGACRGMAFAVPQEAFEAVRDYLRAREQVTSVYLETIRAVRLADGTTVPALTYMVDTAHPQFAGRLTLTEQWALVRSAEGLSGRNVDYVRNTASHLASLGIRDRDVEALAQMAEAV